MISYGEAIDWCIRSGAVMRFAERKSRPEFIFLNKDVPGTKALELAVEIEGRTVAAHAPLDISIEPSKAVALALMECVQFFVEKQSNVLSLN